MSSESAYTSVEWELSEASSELLSPVSEEFVWISAEFELSAFRPLAAEFKPPEADALELPDSEAMDGAAELFEEEFVPELLEPELPDGVLELPEPALSDDEPELLEPVLPDDEPELLEPALPDDAELLEEELAPEPEPEPPEVELELQELPLSE